MTARSLVFQFFFVWIFKWEVFRSVVCRFRILLPSAFWESGFFELERSADHGLKIAKSGSNRYPTPDRYPTPQLPHPEFALP